MLAIVKQHVPDGAEGDVLRDYSARGRTEGMERREAEWTVRGTPGTLQARIVHEIISRFKDAKECGIRLNDEMVCRQRNYFPIHKRADKVIRKNSFSRSNLPPTIPLP